MTSQFALLVLDQSRNTIFAALVHHDTPDLYHGFYYNAGGLPFPYMEMPAKQVKIRIREAMSESKSSLLVSVDIPNEMRGSPNVELYSYVSTQIGRQRYHIRLIQ